MITTDTTNKLGTTEVPAQEPKKGEVRLSVQAMGLIRSESMFMHGYWLEPTKLPAKLGYEASGVRAGERDGDLQSSAGKTEGIGFESDSGCNHPKLAEGRICSEDGTHGETRAGSSNF